MATTTTRDPEKVRAERPVYRTAKHRACDLTIGDVTRNRYGKWDVVVNAAVTEDGKYVNVQFEVGGETNMRSVHLVDVQEVKPS